ncbi:MAG: amidohydrolase [Solirubrobacterales bacterium]|nr:amidohydrolase [Solirubrobacterales bacterium]MBV9800128.1 amidohydrolase [Solirubrobacterales bacterium]
MIEDVYVIEGVAHGLHFAPENQTDSVHADIGSMEHRRIHTMLSPAHRPEFILDKERWLRGADPDLLASSIFAESWSDFAIYHGVPQFGVFRDGGSPLWVGADMRRRWPNRVALYGPVDPYASDALDEVDRLVEEERVVGIKFYPADLVHGRVQTFHMDDERLLFPIYERARQRGLRSVAVHKAIPLGLFPSHPYRVEDVEVAAAAFPDLTFEVVHGGFAFLEETAMLLGRFPNVVVNLEGTTAYLNNAPRRFAEIIGTLLAQFDAEDRILWATGVSAVHPQPPLEAFWSLEIPEELIQSGCRPLTPEAKRKILGLNAARLLGLDIESLKKSQRKDEFGLDGHLAAPWSGDVAFTPERRP